MAHVTDCKPCPHCLLELGRPGCSRCSPCQACRANLTGSDDASPFEHPPSPDEDCPLCADDDDYDHHHDFEHHLELVAAGAYHHRPDPHQPRRTSLVSFLGGSLR
jgi:hypothetical protein